MPRLAIVTTHPIQYYAPIFQLLHQRGYIDIKVFYTWSQSAEQKHDPGFGKDIEWDIPLLDGYLYEFVENTSSAPGSHHAKGIINPQLIQKITDWKPDAILVYGWLYNSHLKVMRHFKSKLPVLFRGDSTLLDDKPGLKSILRLFFLRWVYSYVDYALYPGINTKAYFKRYGLTEEQLIFAPHAVDNNRFTKDASPESITIRERHNIAAGDILILYAGKFEDKKDPLLLLKAFFKPKQPGVHLLMVGNGVLEPAMKQLALGNKNVHFMDFQNQSYMPAIYQACDLFCLPSKGPHETWGLSVNEAMASKKAILVSDKVGCAADLVENGYNGVIFKNSDEGGLLAALMQLTASKKVLNTYGDNSGEKIKGWTITKNAEAIENLMRKLNTAKRNERE
nr:glycosyltransferase family 4 protein [uncultured Mucilaginibacter sp.]